MPSHGAGSLNMSAVIKLCWASAAFRQYRFFELLKFLACIFLDVFVVHDKACKVSEDRKHVWDKIQRFKIRMFLAREWGAQTPRAALVTHFQAYLSASNYVLVPIPRSSETFND